MSMRRLLSVTASLARMVPSARSASSRLSSTLRPRQLAARPSPVQAALSRFGPTAPLATSAAAAAARAEPPPPPPPPGAGEQKGIELDLSAVHSKRRVQRKRSVVKNEPKTTAQPSVDEVRGSSSPLAASGDVVMGLRLGEELANVSLRGMCREVWNASSYLLTQFPYYGHQ